MCIYTYAVPRVWATAGYYPRATAGYYPRATAGHYPRSQLAMGPKCSGTNLLKSVGVGC